MKLKIGELAKITEVTKRTIDYYTNLGLLEAQRSAANYRYYDENAISQIKYIEECKRNRLSLEEIRERLHSNKMDNVDMNHLKEKLENLDKEIKGILQSFESDNQHKKSEMRNTISHESISLIQTLLLLLS